MNASIYTARGRVNGYPDRHAEDIRRVLAERHEVEPERIVLGNGAAELLQAAALALLGDGRRAAHPVALLSPLPADGRPRGRRGRCAVEDVSELRGRGHRAHPRCWCSATPTTRPARYLTAEQIASLASELPERVHVLVDEALVHFQDAEPVDAVLRLTDALPRCSVVRTFSKIYGLSGLRAGYAVGSTASTKLLDAISPVLGVNALTQSAVAQALKIGGPEVERRRASVIRERARLLEALRELPVDVTPSQANFVWLAADGLSGLELASRLSKEGVIVAPGGPLGADDHVRATSGTRRRPSGCWRRCEKALG